MSKRRSTANPVVPRAHGADALRVGHTLYPSGPPRRRVALSIIIPAINRAEWLARSVCSAFLFADGAVEVIVVGDGSTDATRQVLSDLKVSSMFCAFIEVCLPYRPWPSRPWAKMSSR